MQSTIVILAAGIASRYGSMKQTQSFGPSGETIMEYSIYDAIDNSNTRRRYRKPLRQHEANSIVWTFRRNYHGVFYLRCNRGRL